MTVTFDSLYSARCKNGKPYYWKPQPIANAKLTVEDSGVPEAIARILCAAEILEIDVRQYVSEVFRKDSGSLSEIINMLLLSNIADESVHAAQFRYALEAYPVNDQTHLEAECISEAWRSAEGHPLQKAAVLEVGVFVSCSLAILLRCGGNSLSWVSQMVAKDEQRHAAGNLGALKKLGYNPFNYPPQLEELRKQTISWLADGVNIKKWAVNKDWLINQSTLMVHEGRAPQLSAFTSAYVNAMPFENSNKMLVY